MDAIALYAAVVATAALLWNILRDRPRVKVELELGNIFDSSGKEIWQVEVIVINNGRRPIYLQRVGFIFYDGVQFALHHSTFEIDRYLQPGISRTIEIEINDKVKRIINKRLIKYVFAQDDTNKIYKRKMPKKISRIICN